MIRPAVAVINTCGNPSADLAFQPRDAATAQIDRRGKEFRLYALIYGRTAQTGERLNFGQGYKTIRQGLSPHMLMYAEKVSAFVTNKQLGELKKTDRCQMVKGVVVV